MFFQRIIITDETSVHDFEAELKSHRKVLEGKKFTEDAKIPIPNFKGEINDDNGLQL